jgi:hypothetical protein
LDYIAGDGEQLIILYNRWAHHFGPNISPHLVEDTLDVFISRWAPILPYKDSGDYISALSDPPCLVGTFWSKMIASAVTLVICLDSAVAAISEGGSLREVTNGIEIDPNKRFVKRSLVGLAFRRPDLDRSQFSHELRPVRSKT